MSGNIVIDNMSDEEIDLLCKGLIKYSFNGYDVKERSTISLIENIKHNVYGDYIVACAIADNSQDLLNIIEYRERACADEVVLNELDSLLNRLYQRNDVKLDKKI